MKNRREPNNREPISISEANRIIKEIEPMIENLRENYSEFEIKYMELEKIAKNNPTTTELLSARFQVDIVEEQLNILKREIASHRCILRDWSTGTVDMMSTKNGSPIWLCYKLPDKKLRYYHGFHTSCDYRKLIDFE